MPDHTQLPDLQHRAKAVKAHTLRAQGLSLRDIAKQLNAAPSTISQWIKQAEARPDQFFPPAWRDKLSQQLQQLEQFQLDAEQYIPQDPESIQLLNETARAILHTHREIRLTLSALDRMNKHGTGTPVQPEPPDHDDDQRIKSVVIRMSPSLEPDAPFWDFDA